MVNVAKNGRSAIASHCRCNTSQAHKFGTYGDETIYLDHPKISATNSNTEPDRIERLNRVYGYALALADSAADKEFLGKLSHLHDHKGSLVVVWFTEPSEQQKACFVNAWNSKVGDESKHVEHEVTPPAI
jgi:hypothetical protein